MGKASRTNLLALSTAIAVAACAEGGGGAGQNNSAASDREAVAAPLADCLGSARFEGTTDPVKDATLSAARGQSFKPNPVNADVESSLKTPDGNYRYAAAAEDIPVRDTLSRRAVLAHRKALQNVHVRARCADGRWSGWVQVN